MALAQRRRQLPARPECGCAVAATADLVRRPRRRPRALPRTRQRRASLDPRVQRAGARTNSRAPTTDHQETHDAARTAHPTEAAARCRRLSGERRLGPVLRRVPRWRLRGAALPRDEGRSPGRREAAPRRGQAELGQLPAECRRRRTCGVVPGQRRPGLAGAPPAGVRHQQGAELLPPGGGRTASASTSPGPCSRRPAAAAPPGSTSTARTRRPGRCRTHQRSCRCQATQRPHACGAWVEDRGIRTADEAADVAREHAAAHLDADAGLPERRLLEGPLLCGAATVSTTGQALQRRADRS